MERRRRHHEAQRPLRYRRPSRHRRTNFARSSRRRRSRLRGRSHCRAHPDSSQVAAASPRSRSRPTRRSSTVEHRPSRCRRRACRPARHSRGASNRRCSWCSRRRLQRLAVPRRATRRSSRPIQRCAEHTLADRILSASTHRDNAGGLEDRRCRSRCRRCPTPSRDRRHTRRRRRCNLRRSRCRRSRPEEEPLLHMSTRTPSLHTSASRRGTLQHRENSGGHRSRSEYLPRVSTSRSRTDYMSIRTERSTGLARNSRRASSTNTRAPRTQGHHSRGVRCSRCQGDPHSRTRRANQDVRRASSRRSRGRGYHTSTSRLPRRGSRTTYRHHDHRARSRASRS